VLNTYQPYGVTPKRRHGATDQTSAVAPPPLQSHPVSAEPSWIIRAASWLGSAILEGFALHAQSIYPCGLDLTEDCDARAEKALRRDVTPLPPRENPWLRPSRSSHKMGFRAWLATTSSHSPHNARRWF